MTKAEKVTSVIVNQQLFSEVYLREFSLSAHISIDTVNASHQVLHDWREEYRVLDQHDIICQYVRRCLSTLGLFPSPQADGFKLYTDETQTQCVGLCLIVDDADLGRATKGKHYQAKLIQALRSNSLNWGMITNGKRWRLCQATALAPYEVFLEAELDSLLDQNPSDFTHFYCFFGVPAFTLLRSLPASSTYIGLDQYLKESEKRIEAAEKYLRSRIESVLSSLCLGFVDDERAELYTPEVLEIIYQNATFLLYRILFLFYAEARELLPNEDTEYQQASLAAIVKDAWRHHKEGAQDSDIFSLWDRLAELCAAIGGRPTLKVYPYNGGLFNNDEKPYLKNHRIKNVYLARALTELGYMPGKAGYQPIDYRDLAVRHLGTLYEGMLEYRLHLADKERLVIRESNGKRAYIPQSEARGIKRNEPTIEVGQVYFADDKGERKSTGSYYTPEDVVQYIVSSTVIPKLQERREPLEQLLEEVQCKRTRVKSEQERVELEKYADEQTKAFIEHELLKLRILDPAMGSAHFLVAAGQVFTNFIIETLNMTEGVNNAISTDPKVWKRRVVERCLYGVDLNLLAYELAKLALWLASASKDKPLTFLNHHLKSGNTLYSVPRACVSIFPWTKKNSSIGESNHLQRSCEGAVQDSQGKLASIITMDSNDIWNVKDKDTANRRAVDAMQPWRDIAHVWLAPLFGLGDRDAGQLNENGYLQIVEQVQVDHAVQSWEEYVARDYFLREARSIAKKNGFFHWELEFSDAVVDGQCQFDVIIANPPYVSTSPNQAILSLYETARCGDLFAWILEQSLHLLGNKGIIGMIVPLSLMFSRSFRQLRDLLLSRNLHLRLSSYDNIPDSLFNGGKTSENTNKENSQRTTVLLAQAISETTIVETTDLLRWRHEDRSMLFTSLRFADTTAFCSQEGFPRIGNQTLALFWAQFTSMKRTLSDLCAEIFSEARRPQPDTLFLTLPRATRYFVSAIEGPMSRNGVLSLSFSSKNDMDLARVLLNSNVFYWYWRAFGDGFHLNVEIVGDFPVPNIYDDEYLRLAARLDAALNECATHKAFHGKELLNYNFNKRMDILLDMDAWIVRQVNPNLQFPSQIFAQYKSNSFLHPYHFNEDTTTFDEEQSV